ncbi:MAG TPA: UbiA family prenyltransferase [Candidatus Eisenbacteria bacterium]
MRRALDLLFALRPLLWIPAVALYGAGSAWGSAARAAARAGGGSRGAARFPGADGPASGTGPWETALPLASLLLILAAVHAANAWRDREGDRRNEKGRALARGLVSRGDLARAGALAVALAAAIAIAPPLTPAVRALLVAAAALGAAYAAPGISLKERAGLDLASHAAGYGVVAFLLGAAVSGALPDGSPAAWRDALFASLPYAIGVGSVSLLTMIADAPGDAAAGQRTLAVRLGADRSWALAGLLAWGAALTGLIAVEAAPAIWGVAAGATLGLGPDRSRRTAAGAPGARRVNRLAIGLQLLFLALLLPLAPWTGVVAAVLGVAASAYDRVRFGEGYPLARILASGRARGGESRA